MKKLKGFLAGGCFVLTGLVCSLNVAAAQDTAPPKVLVIQREMLKPGHAGATHLKTESAFVQAMTAAKWQTHYFGMESLSGVSRALFFIGYPSFAAWEQDNMATAKNSTLSSAFDRAALADGEQLTEYSTGVFTLDEDGSLGIDKIDIVHTRYFEITQFVVKPGHEGDWAEVVKMYKKAYAKAVPDEKWIIFDSMYGKENGGLHLVIIPMHSLAEVDQSISNAKKFETELGASGLKRLGDLAAASIESQQSNLFQFNPKMSYPEDRWIKEDPEFWKPKAAAMTKKATP